MKRFFASISILIIAIAALTVVISAAASAGRPEAVIETAKLSQTCQVPGDYGSIQAAANEPSCTLVDVAAGTFTETVTISRTVTIQGQGPDKTIVDGSGIGDVFTIQTTTEMSQAITITVTLSDMTITNGDTGIYSEAYNENPEPGHGRATIQLNIVNSAVNDNLGNGIRNYPREWGTTEVHVDNSNISGNSGVGIQNSPTMLAWAYLELIGSTISGNSGRGIENTGCIKGLCIASVHITGSTIRGNSGSGIANGDHAHVTVTNSTISGNRSEYVGGGIDNMGRATVLNSTISGNISNWGGGIYNSCGQVDLSNSTISGNRADLGGNLYLFGDADQIIDPCPGSATAEQSIIANSSRGGDCQIVGDGQFNDVGYNLVEDGSCITSGTSLSGDPMLGPLQDNGGPTLTQALLPDSPAIDAGDNATCPDTDQRGYPRPVDGDKNGTAICDIGAYEYILFTDFAYLPALFK